MVGRDRIRALWAELRFRVHLRTRLRKGLRRLRAAAGKPRTLIGRVLGPRLRSWRARATSRRRRRQIASLDELPGARPSTDLTPPRDSRGVLRAGAGNGPATDPDSIDVVVCVRDALADVHRCLASVLESSERPLRLIVVDDGSAEPTAAYLSRFQATNPAVDLHRNRGPEHGYTIAANIGLRASTAEHVILLNSDTIATRGWLEQILAAARAGDGIGIVGPLSNAASHQSVPEVRDRDGWAVNELPGWLTPDGMAALVARLSEEDAIEVPFVNGFCYCVRRGVIEAIGFLDEERFADGYSEENDFSRRAAGAGFSLAVAPRAYVAHAKSRSYGRDGRGELASRNYRRFVAKHGEDEIRERVAELDANPSLTAVRERVAEATGSPHATVAHLPRLRVTFVLPGIAEGGSGGSHSIYQEVAAMNELGLRARIAIAGDSRERVARTYPGADGLFVSYRDELDLRALLAGDDVAVATHFKSVPSVAAMVADRSVRLGAYYVQDYEPLFTPEGSPDAVEASASYRLIPDGVLFAKTDWIRETLAEREGVAVAKVEPSLDLATFHARGRAPENERPHVIAMLRPRTPRRAPRETLDVLEHLASRYGRQVRITTFGCDADELASLGAIPEAIEHRDILSREAVAELMRTADVFLDCSWYQAFGRTSLEAMACGATTVLPRVGGVTEFAEDGVNCLLADTSSCDATYAALARLIDDRELLRRLQSAAVRTAERYSATRAALSEYSLFCHEIGALRPDLAIGATSDGPRAGAGTGQSPASGT